MARDWPSPPPFRKFPDSQAQEMCCVDVDLLLTIFFPLGPNSTLFLSPELVPLRQSG